MLVLEDARDKDSQMSMSVSEANGGRCPRCKYAIELNEALTEENQRLRDRMEGMILLIDKFDKERAELSKQNEQKILELEQEIKMMSHDRNAALVSQNKDYEQTIRCLQEHVRKLEHANFQNELNSISMVSAQNVSAAPDAQPKPDD